MKRRYRCPRTCAVKEYLSTAYTAFVAKADHKAVHVTCHPPVFDDSMPRFTCHEEFLEDEDCVARILHAISAIEAPPKDWWDIAVQIICSQATAYHWEVPPPPTLFNIMGWFSHPQNIGSAPTCGHT